MSQEITPFAALLLAWYDRERRVLPWRERPGPYRTWISEIMLQQTRVDAVIPYFERFMGRFPTVDALAESPSDEVLTAWSGFGYYSRARNLHAAARAVAARGGFPETVDGLRALPGIGDYTAGAIASIALGLDATAVDGNIERVLARVERYAGPRKGVEPLARRHLPAGRAGDFNQALMDLGARICAPRSPQCAVCPVSSACGAHAAGDVDRYPVKAKKKPSPRVQAAAGVLVRDGLLLLARRPERGLLGGLYELPGDDLAEGEDPIQGLIRAWRDRLGLDITAGERLGEVVHVFTHRHLTLHVFAVRAAGEPRASWYTALRWADPRDPGEVGLSTLAARSLALATSPDRQARLF